MPLFQTIKNSTKQLKKKSFRNEKELQSFVENNLETLFGVRFLASEFTTSQRTRTLRLRFPFFAEAMIYEFL